MLIDPLTSKKINVVILINFYSNFLSSLLIMCNRKYYQSLIVLAEFVNISKALSSRFLECRKYFKLKISLGIKMIFTSPIDRHISLCTGHPP